MHAGGVQYNGTAIDSHLAREAYFARPEWALDVRARRLREKQRRLREKLRMQRRRRLQAADGVGYGANERATELKHIVVVLRVATPGSQLQLLNTYMVEPVFLDALRVSLDQKIEALTAQVGSRNVFRRWYTGSSKVADELLRAESRVSGFWSYQLGAGGVMTTTTTTTSTTRTRTEEEKMVLIEDNSHLYLCVPMYLPRGGEAESF